MTTLETFKLAVKADGTGNDSIAYHWHTIISNQILIELERTQIPELSSHNRLRQHANSTATAILKQLLDIEVQA